jgi:hypothetical protein
MELEEGESGAEAINPEAIGTTVKGTDLFSVLLCIFHPGNKVLYRSTQLFENRVKGTDLFSVPEENQA